MITQKIWPKSALISVGLFFVALLSLFGLNAVFSNNAHAQDAPRCFYNNRTDTSSGIGQHTFTEVDCFTDDLFVTDFELWANGDPNYYEPGNCYQISNNNLSGSLVIGPQAAEFNCDMIQDFADGAEQDNEENALFFTNCESVGGRVEEQRTATQVTYVCLDRVSGQPIESVGTVTTDINLEPQIMNNCQGTITTVQESCIYAGVVIPIINFLSAGVGLFITGMIVVAGFQYLTSEGDPQRINSAKDRIFNAVVAMLAYMLMYGILQWLVPGGLFN